MAGIGSRGLGGAFPQKILKFISHEMLFCAFSWKHFLIKKSILVKVKMPGILRDYKDFIQFYPTALV